MSDILKVDFLKLGFPSSSNGGKKCKVWVCLFHLSLLRAGLGLSSTPLSFVLVWVCLLPFSHFCRFVVDPSLLYIVFNVRPDILFSSACLVSPPCWFVFSLLCAVFSVRW